MRSISGILSFTCFFVFSSSRFGCERGGLGTGLRYVLPLNKKSIRFIAFLSVGVLGLAPAPIKPFYCAFFSISPSSLSLDRELDCILFSTSF